MISLMTDERKRQNLPAKPGLWLVATPLGNIQDFSPRARLALENADAVLCEDTRRTSRLIAAVGLEGIRLERLDEHASEHQIGRFVERLLEGESFAVVTDAGTPGVSDPAAAIVRAARDAGVSVTPIPGPSAVTALLSICGFRETAFTFRGFFPRKDSEREKEVRMAADSPVSRLCVWFESPERISESLAILAREQSSARVVACKELTKIHEKTFDGTAEEVARHVADEIAREGALGEWVFAVMFAQQSVSESDEAELAEQKNAEWTKALRMLLDVPLSASDAARRVSQHFGAPKKLVYDLALKLSGKK